ncbi:hypothetical protein [Amycolatopsis sp. NPDC004378]
MPIPADAQSALSVLLEHADQHEDPVIREVALRAGLLQQCRCGWHNPAADDRCKSCRTRLLPAADQQTVPAVGLIAVRDYLTEAHGDADGDARFVAACRAGICGGLAFDVADDVLAGAQQYSYGNSWPVIAEEIVAGVEARAAAHGAARISPAPAS